MPEEEFVEKVFSTPFEAIQNGLDAAIIASPASVHLEQTISFLDADIPVLIEKPLCDSYDNCRKLSSSAMLNKDAWRCSMVGYVLRFHPGYIRLKEMLGDNRLGQPRNVHVVVNSYLPDWRPGQDYKETVSAQRALGGGVMRELSHEIDYVNDLVGPIISVIGWRNEETVLGIDAEEHVELLLLGRDKLPIFVKLDFATQAPPSREIEIDYERGKITCDFLEGSISLALPYQSIKKEDFSIERDYLFERQFAHFLNVINGGTVPQCTIEAGIDVMKIIDAIERSFLTQHWETV
ncbi:MAG: hypothetical protein AVO39_11760 [delta proteobacterium MLS_D]|nr:MAG: hypothetical protein AVO39_11760 [delta proteobacterium MLS_D]